MGRGSSKLKTTASFKPATTATLAAHEKSIKRLSGDEYGAATYDLDTLKTVSYNRGYQVSFYQIGAKYTPQEYADTVNEFLRASSDGIASAGKYDGTPEISFHVSSKREAIRLARKYNQVSVYDWNAADLIFTGGTGRKK